LNKLDIKDFRKTLVRHIISRILLETVLYTVALLLSVVLAYFAASLFYWYDYDPVYILLSRLANYRVFIILIVWLAGFIFICFRYWRKTVAYIEKLVEAGNALVQSDDERIRLPIELATIEDQLNQIKTESRKNQRAAKDAEQRKNDLVVYLAHDLKTPLTSVIGYLTLLHDEQQISEELRERYLSVSLEKAQRLEELINEFFEITRFNLSTLILDISEIHLSRMLEQIVYEFGPMLKAKNLSCTLSSEKDLTIKGDVIKLERVFDNLLRNAVNYSFQESDIIVTAVRCEAGVKMQFINHGNTIPAQKLDHIFDQFFRLDTARSSSTGGAGLGLAIAKEIVELHKGTISAESENEIIKIEIFLPDLL